MFCRSLFIRLSFFFWPFCCLSFLDLRLLVTSLISSNFSYFDDDTSVTNIQSGQFSCLTIGGYLVGANVTIEQDSISEICNVPNGIRLSVHPSHHKPTNYQLSRRRSLLKQLAEDDYKPTAVDIGLGRWVYGKTSCSGTRSFPFAVVTFFFFWEDVQLIRRPSRGTVGGHNCSSPLNACISKKLYRCYFLTIFSGISAHKRKMFWEWVSANSAIVQLYHGENKLIFNEMMMRSALY